MSVPTIHTTKELIDAITLTEKQAASAGFNGLLEVEVLFENGQPQSFRYATESRSDRKTVQAKRSIKTEAAVTGKPG